LDFFPNRCHAYHTKKPFLLGLVMDRLAFARIATDIGELSNVQKISNLGWRIVVTTHGIFPDGK
jgi:hypothetical protein